MQENKSNVAYQSNVAMQHIKISICWPKNDKEKYTMQPCGLGEDDGCCGLKDDAGLTTSRALGRHRDDGVSGSGRTTVL
jgi:hypothetical protein